MSIEKTVFSQLMGLYSHYDFRKCVERYNGNYRVKKFLCRDQYLCMAFAQLTYRECLRDIEIFLRSMQERLYHMGIRGKVSRSTLAEANEKRDWRIYADFAQVLIHRARELYFNEEFCVQLDETVYALDCASHLIVRVVNIELMSRVTYDQKMLEIIKYCCRWLCRNFNIVANLAAENVSLRHQIIVLKRNNKRPVLKERDRMLWVLLSRVWTGWRTAILIVQPDTVVRWHK